MRVKIYTAAKYLFLILAVTFASLCAAEPYVPESTSLILARVPIYETSVAERFEAQPDTADARREHAKQYILLGRSQNDPRLLGRAESLLQPLFDTTSPDVETLILSATINEYFHDFKQALHKLDRALKLDPGSGQAWLLKANIEIVQGEFPAAKTSCKKLLPLVDQRIALICMLQVDGLNKNTPAASAALKDLLSQADALQPAIASWALGILADMEERSSLATAARSTYTRALAQEPESLFLKVALADLLYEAGSPQAALSLIDDLDSSEASLVRKAIFLKKINPQLAEDVATSLRKIFTAESDRGDAVHLRERALFELHYEEQPAKALEAARQNWQSQREPIDTLLFAQAASQSGDSDSIDRIKTWQEQSGYIDARLTAALLRGGRN